MTVAAWSAVSLEIQNVDTDAGTLDIYMINDEEVGGFQFELLGINITGASTPDGFFVSTSSTTILAFSLTGATIPAGEGILTQVTFAPFAGESICFGIHTCTGLSCHNNVFSDSFGLPIDIIWGDCYCTLTIDCADECGGSAIVDCEGACNGTAMLDECGVCNGDGYIDCIAITGCETENICDESECLAKDCADVCGGNSLVNFGCHLNGILVIVFPCGNQEKCDACLLKPEDCP